MTSVPTILLRTDSVTSPLRDIDAMEVEPDSASAIDQSRFAALIEQHQDALLRFLFRYARNAQDAEDLVQDTFVKAYRNLHRYDSKYKFSTWLYTIARRTAYNYLRDRKPSEPLEQDIVETSARPDEEAASQDERAWVWRAAARLKPSYREALELKYVDDLSIEEIAAIMGKSQTNVKIILFRARNQLKRLKPQAERRHR